jgi:hypothetical protein
MINIVCVLKESNLYSKEWVYKLQRSVDKHLQIPHRFVCLSNVPLDCEYRLLDEDVEGWWNKIQLFKPNFFTEETIYFDLDVVISKPLDELINNLRSQNKNFMKTKLTTWFSRHFKNRLVDVLFVSFLAAFVIIQLLRFNQVIIIP